MRRSARKIVLYPKLSRGVGTELKFGVAKSEAKKKNQKALENFLSGIQILPIFPALDIYAEEKSDAAAIKIINNVDHARGFVARTLFKNSLGDDGSRIINESKPVFSIAKSNDYIAKGTTVSKVGDVRDGDVIEVHGSVNGTEFSAQYTVRTDKCNLDEVIGSETIVVELQVD